MQGVDFSARIFPENPIPAWLQSPIFGFAWQAQSYLPVCIIHPPFLLYLFIFGAQKWIEAMWAYIHMSGISMENNHKQPVFDA